MKIALIGPVEEKIPPLEYGGTERVVYDLARMLAARGHEVDLYATGDSDKSDLYTLIPILDARLRINSNYSNPKMIETAKLQAAARAAHLIRQKKYDIIHSHSGWRFLLMSQELSPRPITTHHMPLTIDFSNLVFQEYKDFPHTSLSLTQQKGFPDLNYVANIYNGIDLAEFDPLYELPDTAPLAFLGRTTPEKGVLESVQTARATGRSITIGAKISHPDSDYTKSFLSLVDGKQVVFPGEMGTAKKKQLLTSARALIMPVSYEDPCPLVPLEAMACGTPVIAYAMGALPEQVKDGVSGYLVTMNESDVRGDWIVKKTGIDGLEEAVNRIYSMDRDAHMNLRKSTRAHMEANFTAEIMVDQYEKLYQSITSS